MNIFEIQSKIDEILSEAIDNEGDIGESRLEELAIAQEELEQKLYAYAFVCDRFDSDIALLKQYKAALDSRIKTNESKKAKLKQIIADTIWKYGDPVMKKGEPTGAYSLKTTNMTMTVKKVNDVEVENDMANEYLQTIKGDILENKVSTETLEQINEFAKCTIDMKFTPNKFINIIKTLKEHGCFIEKQDINITYTKTDLIKVLNERPENLDAWTLTEKDSLTIRK
ncbi:MAG: hypothetical protein HDQ88_04730 [Clostridia bacterium]|nr:hypothetical protein [Clostridia bacterium]